MVLPWSYFAGLRQIPQTTGNGARWAESRALLPQSTSMAQEDSLELSQNPKAAI